MYDFVVSNLEFLKYSLIQMDLQWIFTIDNNTEWWHSTSGRYSDQPAASVGGDKLPTGEETSQSWLCP